MEPTIAQSQASPRLHRFISSHSVQSKQSPSSHPRKGVLSPTKPTLHLSPQKFYRLQEQQRQAVLRGMLPLSPIRHQQKEERETMESSNPTLVANLHNKEPVPWNPAWLPLSLDDIPVASAKSVGAASLSFGTTSLDSWLESFDHDILQYESLERFAQVKLPEAMAYCDKMEKHIAAIQLQEQREESTSRHGSQHSLNGKTIRKGGGVARRPRDSSAMTRFPVRFRVAVFANLVERSILAMTQSPGFAHLKPWLLQARQELFRAVFADYDEYSRPQKIRRLRGETVHPGGSGGDEEVSEDGEDHQPGSDIESDEDEASDEPIRHQNLEPPQTKKFVTQYDRLGPDVPRPLSFFLSRVPFILKLHDDTQRRAMRFERHQVVLRRIVQSLYRSLGSVFHAWKMYARQRHEEQLNDKGAQLTAMVVIQRGLVRTIFVEWSKCTLKTKLVKAYEREARTKRVHEERINDLYKELILLREQNTKLEQELKLARSGDFCESTVEGEGEEDAAD